MLREAVESARNDEQKIEAVLGLNVLDPSMGSGHFLVEATEQIARFLVELGVASLDADVFVEEVRRRRPKSEGRLTPVALRDLRSSYTEMTTPVREERAEAAKLERRLSDLVNRAYGLTPEDVDLLWSTAPPRMPKF